MRAFTAMKFLGIDLDGLWWWLCKGFLWIIDGLDKAFNFLIGADTVSASANQGQGGNFNNLFVTIFNGGENGEGTNMTRLYLYIMLGCIAFLCIFIAIGAIKAQFTKGVTESLQQLGMKSLFAIIKMIAIPIVFFVALQAMGVIINFLIGIMSTGTDSQGLAQSLLNACWSGSEVPTVLSGFTINMEFDTLKEFLTDRGAEFNYLLCILSSGFLVVTLVTVSISLVKRIIEVFFYYLTAPIALCRTPLDDGKSFDLWKENVVSKLLGAGGIVITMYLFYTIIPIFNQAVAEWESYDHDNRGVVATVLQILFIIGGSTVPASASMLMAQLISQGAGQNESNNMMHTQQMLGNGIRVATGAGGRALLGAMGKGAVGVAGGAGAVAAGGVGGVAATVAGAVGAIASKPPTAAAGGAAGAARAGSAAMSAISARSGGASGASNPTAQASGAVPRAASGARPPVPTKSFKQHFKDNVSKSWAGGKEKIANASPYLGIAGKAGAAIGVGVKGTLGTIAAAPKAGIQKGVEAVKGSKTARHLEHRRDERNAGKAVAKAAKADKAKQNNGVDKNDRTQTKYQSLDNAMAKDRENNTNANTSAYMNQKIKNWEDRAKKIDDKLKKKDWSDERKREYRRTQLESEANRISAFADQAHGSMNDESINRFKSFYDRMGRDLYGDGENKENGGNEN